MRVTEKGQVTIPKELRERTGIGTGTEVEFVVDGDTLILQRAKRRERPGPTRGERIVRALRGTATRNRQLSTDQIMHLLRGDDD